MSDTFCATGGLKTFVPELSENHPPFFIIELSGVKAASQRMNGRKAAGLSGNTIVFFKFCGPNSRSFIYIYIQLVLTITGPKALWYYLTSSATVGSVFQII